MVDAGRRVGKRRRGGDSTPGASTPSRSQGGTTPNRGGARTPGTPDRGGTPGTPSRSGARTPGGREAEEEVRWFYVVLKV